jgi:tRNA threonylcarbamoyladenosine biosynthesis protein TsaE
MKYISKTEKETYQIAANLAKKLKGGEIIALEGDLGAGKTTFVKGLAKAFGIKQHVTSPTFVLMKIYECRNPKSEIRNLVHVDCYRLDEPQELFYLGIEEYLNKPDTIIVIEWADKIKGYLKKFKKIIWLKIKIQKNQRNFNIIL